MNARWGTRLVSILAVPGVAAMSVLSASAAPAALGPAAPSAQPTAGWAADEPATDDRGDRARPGGRKKPPPVVEDEVEEPDTEAPAPPVLSEPTVLPDGVVEVTLSAEEDARIVMVEVLPEGGERRVLSDTATGAEQLLTWTAVHGPHEYELIATDEAGNDSDVAELSVDVDARAPRPQAFAVKAGTASDSRSVVRLRTEPDASYRLLLDGDLLEEGTTDGPVRLVLDVPDGTHEVTAELTDEVGNERVVARTLEVSIPSLMVDADVLTDSTRRLQKIRVTTTPNAVSGRLEVPGGPDRDLPLVDGVAQIKVKLDDGTYEAPRVTVTDSQGRTGSARLPDLTVDTTGPEVAVVADPASAETGLLSFAVQGEPGDTAGWRILNADRVIVASGDLTLGEEPSTVVRDVEEGDYEVEVTAEDAYGRTSVDRLSTSVAAEPRSLADVGLLIGAASAALAASAAGTVMVVRRRRRTRRLAGRRRSSWARRLRRHRARVKAEPDVAAYLAAEADWRARRDAVSSLLATIREVLAAGAAPASRRETELYSAPARLLEPGLRDNEPMLVEADSGRVVVTDCRVSFVGDRRRDWVFDPLDRVRHVGMDQTLVRGVQDDDWWGLAYADPEVTRLALDFALTERTAARESFVAALTQWLRQHDMRRPTAPARTAADASADVPADTSADTAVGAEPIGS